MDFNTFNTFLIFRWNLPEPDNYALRFDDEDKKGYITERVCILKILVPHSKAIHHYTHKGIALSICI